MSPEEIVAVVRGIGGLLEPGAADAWRIALAQVAVEARVYAMWRTVASAFAGILAGLSFLEFRANHDYGMWDFLAGLSVVCMVVAFLLSAAVYGRTTNAEYYALSWLIQTVVPH